MLVDVMRSELTEFPLVLEEGDEGIFPLRIEVGRVNEMPVAPDAQRGVNGSSSQAVEAAAAKGGEHGSKERSCVKWEE